MSIRCRCENGHELKVKDSLAGRTGLCPICRGRVEVPSPHESAISEDAILGLLGASDPATRVNSGGIAAPDAGSQSGINLRKNCDKCGKEVSAAAHICPYCHTYIANLRDF